MVRIFTFSYRRLNFVCALINSLKAQTHADFIHHLHLLDYPEEQVRFVQQVVNGDRRFVISHFENLSQRENLLRILGEMPPGAECYIRMDDDDVYLPTYLEEIRNASLANKNDLTAFTTLLRYNQRAGKSNLIQNSGIYGNTMCLSRRAVEHLLSKPNWEMPGFEDSWIDKSLAQAGFKRHITQTERPLVLYVQHATNISCSDQETPNKLKAIRISHCQDGIATLPKLVPTGPPDCIIPILDKEWEGNIKLYETGVFALEATEEAGYWEIAEEGSLILDFWSDGRRALYSVVEK